MALRDSMRRELARQAAARAARRVKKKPAATPVRAMSDGPIRVRTLREARERQRRNDRERAS